MRLRNKKTGEIVDLSEGFIRDTYCGSMIQVKPVAISNKQGYLYESLAEFNKEWEDAPEEPKEYWYIRDDGSGVVCLPIGNSTVAKRREEIGNYFLSKEEAEKAVEKLKAFTRLKERGFRFERWLLGGEYGNTITFSDYFESDDKTRADLDLLFGGEE